MHVGSVYDRVASCEHNLHIAAAFVCCCSCCVAIDNGIVAAVAVTTASNRTNAWAVVTAPLFLFVA